MLKCDFVGGPVNHRLLFGGGRGQDLPKAVGMKAGPSPRVTDVTAGLGRDAFLLASLGSEVTLIERSDVMHSLLQDGMEAARRHGGIHAEIMSRMTLIHGDSIELLPSLSPEIVLIDPMHPPRKKSALVKAEFREIREIVGIDTDQLTLIETALATVSKRVVLKWPTHANALEGLKACSHQIVGKSIRFDVFMCQ
ncbi:class I SAM-dependent methyltransferase [Alphaproteobacteria bacterium]|nr:class I SAM-dependent methyltransferase [Alphaproteobacteria bacterium]